MSDKRGTMSAGRDRKVRQVETMMTADSLRLTAPPPRGWNDRARLRNQSVSICIHLWFNSSDA
jgi:hypothetical protein